jgi:hypothetical protein
MTKNEEQRLYRLKTGNASTFKYEKSFKGFVMRMYRNMKSRITGIQKEKAYLYKGKELLPKDQFYSLAYSSVKLKELFNYWEAHHYNQRLTPSVNRIDSTKGYSIGNIEFITHSENSRLAALKGV